MGESERIQDLIWALAERITNDREYTQLAVALQIPQRRAESIKFVNIHGGMTFSLIFLGRCISGELTRYMTVDTSFTSIFH